MAKNQRELEEQTNIIKSLRAEGGYGRKISHRFAIGIPDLMTGLPPFVPALCEVKDLGAVVDKFDREIGITDKQALELKRFSEPYELHQTRYTPNRRAGFILVHIVHRKRHRLVALRREETRLTYAYEETPNCWSPRGLNGIYPCLTVLWDHIGIAKVRLT